MSMEIKEIAKLEPREVFEIFSEITQVSRPSGKEQKIREYLIGFAKKNGLEYTTDGENVFIVSPATKGMENCPAVVLQSHMDMVCAKVPELEFDFAKDAIPAYIDGDFIRTHGTTLGADDGIGMALALALLSDKKHPHGRLEGLFTSNEEDEFTGVNVLAADMLTGQYLINIDHGKVGDIIIGSASAIELIAEYGYGTCQVPQDWNTFRINVSGLKGGHSGLTITDHTVNAIKVLAETLLQAMGKVEMKVCALEGGEAKNAIPKSAQAIVAVPAEQTGKFVSVINSCATETKERLCDEEPGIDIAAEQIDSVPTAYDDASIRSVLEGISNVISTVCSHSTEIEGAIEASSNLGIVRDDGQHIVVRNMPRGISDAACYKTAEALAASFEKTGATTRTQNFSTAWTGSANGRFVRFAAEQYERLTGEKAWVMAEHAGLECGAIIQKYPKMEAISIGPNLFDEHTPAESLQISSVGKVWDYCIRLLENIQEA